MKKLLIATKNQGKLHELSQFLSEFPVQLVSLTDIGIIEDVEEDGITYEQNSQKKALFYAEKSGLPAIADDGGIEIKGLNWGPGIKSRRYFGKNGKEATDEEIVLSIKKLIKNLSNDDKQSKFKTVVSLALPDNKIWSVTGEIDGILMDNEKLREMKGYPYRSFFYLPKLKKYYYESELTQEEQKLYNHRYIAIQKLKPILKKALNI